MLHQSRASRAALALVLAGAAVAHAQDTTRLLRGAVIMRARETPAPAAVSVDTFANSFGHRVLMSGAIVVNHTSLRRVLFLDSTLATRQLLFDATTPPPLSYPSSDARLYNGQGDSTYFFDRPAHAFRVIGPDGRLIRTQPVVDSANFAIILSVPGGRFDERGRVLLLLPQEKRVATGMPRQLRDSMYLLRIDPARAGRDTIAVLYNRQTELRATRPDSLGGNQPTITRVVPAFDFGDAWAITSRNEIMILRAVDYSVSWLGADGRWRKTAPIPWPRVFVPAERKATLLAQARGAAARVTPVPDLNGRGPVGARTIVQVDDSVGDRVPVFWPMTASADADGGFWIHTGTPSMGRAQGPPQFLHIDATGAIIDNVYIPTGRFMQGITRNGMVFVATTPAGGQYERIVLQPRPR